MTRDDSPEKRLWSEVDHYLEHMLIADDAVLDRVIESSAAAGLPGIQVAPAQGKLLYLFARLIRANRILEMGTLGAYSTIWLARGLEPGGRLVTLESNAKHAEIARANLVRAGLGSVAEIRLGPALETLPRLLAERAGPFDLVFIDADKPSLAEYFDWALRLSRKGSLILADNVVREGGVIRPGADANVDGVRRMMERMKNEPRVTATAIQTVGVKGHDGLALALVVADP